MTSGGFTMFRRLFALCIFGVMIISASCAEPPQEDEPETAPQPVVEKIEGPYYELTKEEVTSHPDWTSMNVKFKGAKIGDKYSPALEKDLGKVDKTDPVGTDHYRSIFDKSSFAIYTHKMTGELQKFEIYAAMADKIADPKFKKLLTGGSLDYMREAFGKEEMSEINFNTTGMEYFYDAKGFRFVQYAPPGAKPISAILFSKIKQ
jgi:hypothetical protein